MKNNNKPNEKKAVNFSVVAIMIIFFSIAYLINNSSNILKKDMFTYNKNKEFKIISSSENKDLENIINNFSNNKDIDVSIEYAGTLDIMEKLNSGEKYDAVWASNSIWLYMLDSSVKVSNSKSTSINPVVFAIKKSKAEELGFIGKDIYTKDIVNVIKNGNLKFSMSNPTQTNTGATAYLGLLSTLAGNPEVLKEDILKDSELKEELISLFSGLERSSGSEDFLEELFINGSYEAVVTYESSIININKQLEAQGKETLYVLYPVDGVSISDSPLAFLDSKDEVKEKFFYELQTYILSNEGQEKLAEKGRRTWYGGITNNADETVFNPNWGIDTTKYIVPIKFPSTAVIQKALGLYQTELRKPIHTVFCLDYSGSMYGTGYNELKNAMNYILTESEASKDLLQFSEKDKITVIPFSTNIIDIWNTDNGLETQEIIDNMYEITPNGSTNIYDTCIEGLNILSKEDMDKYNVSIILMTDGMSNIGNINNLRRVYDNLNLDIPIYSIMFGDAYEYELQNIADLTNAKIFNGKTDLLKAFKEVRGYN